MSGQRSVPARAGIAALNLLAPGLGPLRLGRRKAAACFLVAAPAALVLIVTAYALAPRFGFPAFAAAMILFVAVGLGSIVGSAVMSWRASRGETERESRWTRWYAIAGALVAWIASLNLLTQAAHSFYKPFYLPSEAMAPTLVKDDRFVAAMGQPATLRRGDIILLRMSSDTYVKRLAGLPGDTIEMVGGQLFLNGRAVPQRLEAVERIEGPGGPYQARRLAERFPGESRPHSIYDEGPSAIDDFPATRIQPGHVFVLGDNRDRSADSRVPPPERGVGHHPIDRIGGIALFHSIFSSRKAGHPLAQ